MFADSISATGYGGRPSNLSTIVFLICFTPFLIWLTIWLALGGYRGLLLIMAYLWNRKG